MTILVGSPERGNSRNFLSHGAVDVRLDPNIMSAWRAAGGPGTGFIDDGIDLKIASQGARLENLPIGGDGELLFRLSFKRLPSTQPGTYLLDVVQLEGSTVVGGVTYEIHVPKAAKDPRPDIPGVR